MIFVNRSPRAPDRFLPWKVGLFVAAGLLIYFGVRLELRWVLWIAIALLLVAVGLRFVPRERDAERRDDE
jgi:membrane protein implicated in regulation of membrane protease activity